MASAQSDADWQSSKKTVLERTSHMFNNSDMSDISFTSEGSDKSFYAHKYVLATSSAVFHAMFYGPLAEKNSVIHLSDTDEKSLEEFLRFLYTDQSNITSDIVVSVMYLSKKYIVPSLTEYLKAILVRDMEPGNVMFVLEQAVQFEEKDLEEKCWQVIEWRISEVLASTSFNNISQKTLASLLKRNNLNTSEVELFQAVIKWIDFNCVKKNLDQTRENKRSVIGEAIYDLRFIAMSQEEFAKHVSKSSLLSFEELVPIYEKLNKLESPALKWILPARKRTFNASQEEIRISRFSKGNHGTPWEYFVVSSLDWEMYEHRTRPCDLPENQTDFLAFSVDQQALFLGVRLFGKPTKVDSERRDGQSPNKYEIDLTVNRQRRSVTYESSTTKHTTKDGICGFDVMLQSPILVNENEVVKMEARIIGPVSYFGCCGKSSVRKERVTVTFIDCIGNKRTCVSQGQFQQIILSI